MSELKVAMTPFELTEQAVAQESATEALADEMMRIRKDLEKMQNMESEISQNILLLRDSMRDLTICLKEMEEKQNHMGEMLQRLE